MVGLGRHVRVILGGLYARGSRQVQRYVCLDSQYLLSKSIPRRPPSSGPTGSEPAQQISAACIVPPENQEVPPNTSVVKVNNAVSTM